MYSVYFPQQCNGLLDIWDLREKNDAFPYHYVFLGFIICSKNTKIYPSEDPPSWIVIKQYLGVNFFFKKNVKYCLASFEIIVQPLLTSFVSAPFFQFLFNIIIGSTQTHREIDYRPSNDLVTCIYTKTDKKTINRHPHTSRLSEHLYLTSTSDLFRIHIYCRILSNIFLWFIIKNNMSTSGNCSK